MRAESIRASGIKEKTTRNLTKLVETFTIQPKKKSKNQLSKSNIVEPSEIYK